MHTSPASPGGTHRACACRPQVPHRAPHARCAGGLSSTHEGPARTRPLCQRKLGGWWTGPRGAGTCTAELRGQDTKQELLTINEKAQPSKDVPLTCAGQGPGGQAGPPLHPAPSHRRPGLRHVCCTSPPLSRVPLALHACQHDLPLLLLLLLIRLLPDLLLVHRGWPAPLLPRWHPAVTPLQTLPPYPLPLLQTSGRRPPRPPLPLPSHSQCLLLLPRPLRDQEGRVGAPTGLTPPLALSCWTPGERRRGLRV